jgi:peptidylprolyl isomerase
MAAAVAAAGLLAGGLAGCGDEPSDSGAAPSSAASSSLDAVRVSGGAGAKPKLTFTAPFSVEKTQKRMLSTGSGAKVDTGQRVTVDYVGVNGTDAKEFDTSFGRKQANFTLETDGVIKGFSTSLDGVPVGSRVLLAIPPADGYGMEGVPAAGIGPTDTLLFVIDVTDASTVLKRATGQRVKPKSGLPTVTLDKQGAPSIDIPAGKPPKQMVVQPLITGKGAKVSKGQTITVHYTGKIWASGKVFDSSWQRKKPEKFPIGVGRVITGWDEGLVGRSVGSQMLLVIPPDKGYGAEGNAQISGTDTLVFVVDILDAAS